MWGRFLPLSLVTQFDVHCCMGSIQNGKHRASLTAWLPAQGTPLPWSCQARAAFQDCHLGSLCCLCLVTCCSPGLLGCLQCCAPEPGVLIWIELESTWQPCVKAWFRKIKSRTVSGWVLFSPKLLPWELRWQIKWVCLVVTSSWVIGRILTAQCCHSLLSNLN